MVRSLIWVAVPFTLFPLAEQHINSAVTGLLNGAMPIFAALGVRIPEGGLFAFSVEDLDEGDFKLLPTGRYAQSGAYIDRLAAETGFEVVSRRDFTLRQEWNRPIAGRAYLLERS